MLGLLILLLNLNYSQVTHRGFSVDKLCISIHRQISEFCYDVSSSLKERSGQRRVKLTLNVSR